MKQCVECGKELPDAAMHCAFCGARQAIAATPDVPPTAGGPARTVMGYAAAELLMQQRTADHGAQASQPDHASLPAGSRPVTSAAPDAPTIGIGQNIMRHDLLRHDPGARAEPRPVAIGTPPGAIVPELAAMQSSRPTAGAQPAAVQPSSPALGQPPTPVMGGSGSAPGNAAALSLIHI